MESNVKLKWIASFPSLFQSIHFIKNVIYADNVHSLGAFLKSHIISPLVGVAVYMKHTRKRNLMWGFFLRTGRAKL